MSEFAVIYGKVVDDKELGVYLASIHLGGIAPTAQEADQLARHCVNTCKGGTIFPKIFPIHLPNSLLGIMEQASKKFYALERQMVEAETIIKNSTNRRRR